MDEQAKKTYEKVYAEQTKRAKLIFLLGFGISGTFFLVDGIMMMFSQLSIMGYIFAPIGGLLLVLGLILFLTIPSKGNYENYLKRKNKSVANFSNNIFIRFALLEEENKQLKEKISQLERKTKSLE